MICDLNPIMALIKEYFFIIFFENIHKQIHFLLLQSFIQKEVARRLLMLCHHWWNLAFLLLSHHYWCLWRIRYTFWNKVNFKGQKKTWKWQIAAFARNFVKKKNIKGGGGCLGSKMRFLEVVLCSFSTINFFYRIEKYIFGDFRARTVRTVCQIYR